MVQTLIPELTYLEDSFTEIYQINLSLLRRKQKPLVCTLKADILDSDWHSFGANLVYNTANPSSKQEIRSWKAARSVNPRWTTLILHGTNGVTRKRQWKVKVNMLRKLANYIYL
jgi:hypothetical protein